MLRDIKTEIKILKRRRIVFAIVSTIYVLVGFLPYIFPEQEYGIIDYIIFPIFSVLFILLLLLTNRLIKRYEDLEKFFSDWH